MFLTSFIGKWGVDENSKVFLFFSEREQVEAFILDKKRTLEDKKIAVCFKKIKSHAIFAGPNKTSLSSSLIYVLKENPQNFHVVLVKEMESLFITFIPQLSGGADSVESASSAIDSSRGSALLRMILDNPNRCEKFHEVLREEQDSFPVSYEDLLMACIILSKEQVEKSAFELAYKLCQDLCDFFRRKNVLSVWESEFVAFFKEMYQDLARGQLFAESKKYFAMAMQIISSSEDKQGQFNALLEWGEVTLYEDSKKLFDKYKRAAYCYAAAYHLACNIPELMDRQLEAMKGLLQVEGDYICSEKGCCKALLVWCSQQFHLSGLSVKEKLALLQKIERIADCLFVRRCFLRFNQSDETINPAHVFYGFAIKIAESIHVNASSLKDKRDNAEKKAIPLELFEKEKRLKKRLSDIRQAFSYFLARKGFPTEEEQESLIYKNYEGLAREIFEEACLIFNPEEHPYALLGLGSLSRKEMCPFSDLEAALVAQTAEDAKNLLPAVRFFYLRVIALGESKWPRYAGCKRVMPGGFLLDEINNPFYIRNSVANLVRMQNLMVFDEDVDSVVSLKKSYKKVSVNALRTPCFLSGDASLYEEYRISLMEVLNKGDLRKTLAKSGIKSYLKKFSSFNVTDSLNVKMDLLRLPVLSFEALCLYYNVDFVPRTTDKIKRLCSKGLFSWHVEEKWRYFLEKAFKWRWQIHLDFQEENDFFKIQEKQRKKIQKIYDLLFFPFQKTLQKWLIDEKALNDYMNFEVYVEKGKRKQNERSYKKAEKYFAFASWLKSDLQVLIDLGYLRFFILDFQGAREAWENALNLSIEDCLNFTAREDDSFGVNAIRSLVILSSEQETALNILNTALEKFDKKKEMPKTIYPSSEYLSWKNIFLKKQMSPEPLPFLCEWLREWVQQVCMQHIPKNRRICSLNEVFERLPLVYQDQMKQELLKLKSTKGCNFNEITDFLFHKDDMVLLSLDFSDQDHLTDDSLIKEIKSYQRVQRLDIRNCSRLTGRSIHWLAEHCIELRSLDIRECESIKEKDIITLFFIKSLDEIKMSHAHLKYKNKKKRSLLHYAVLSENKKLVESLVHQGASFHTQDDKGYTPLKLAECLGNREIIKFLQGLEQYALEIKEILQEVDTSVLAEKLDRAVFASSLQNIKVLLDRQVHPSLLTMHLAEFVGNEKVIDQLDEYFPLMREKMGLWKKREFDEFLRFLAKYSPKEFSLNLKYCSDLTDPCFCFLPGQCLPRLKKIDLFGSLRITDEGIRCIAEFIPELEEINLGVERRYEDLDILVVSQQKTQLEGKSRLSSECTILEKTQKNFTINALIYLAEGCKKMRSISLNYRCLLDDELRKVFVESVNFPELVFLDLSDCYQIKEETILEIKEKRPQLDIKQDRLFFPISLPQLLNFTVKKAGVPLSLKVVHSLKEAVNIESIEKSTQIILQTLAEDPALVVGNRTTSLQSDEKEQSSLQLNESSTPEAMGELVHEIVKRNYDFVVFHELLKRGMVVDSLILNLAIRSNLDIETFRLILDAGALLTSKELERVIQGNNKKVLRLFLDYIFFVPQETLDLAIKCLFNDVVSIQKMLEKKTELTQETLSLAVKYNHFRVVKMMLENGLCPTEEALNTAVKYNTLAVVHLILERGILPTQETLLQAKKRKRLKITQLIEEKMKLYECDFYSRTILQGDLKEIADVLSMDDFLISDYHIACAIERNSSAVLNTLLEKKKIQYPLGDSLLKLEESCAFAYFKGFEQGITLLKKYDPLVGIHREMYLTDDMFKRLLEFWKHKKSLDLKGWDKLTDKSFELPELVTRLSHINELNLLGCSSLSNQSLFFISSRFPQLEILAIGFYKSSVLWKGSEDENTESAREAMQYIEKCKNLKTLFIKGWAKLSPLVECLKNPEKFDALRQLTLFHCESLDNEEVNEIRKLKSSLNISEIQLPLSRNVKENFPGFNRLNVFRAQEVKMEEPYDVSKACFEVECWKEYFREECFIDIEEDLLMPPLAILHVDFSCNRVILARLKEVVSFEESEEASFQKETFQQFLQCLSECRVERLNLSNHTELTDEYFLFQRPVPLNFLVYLSLFDCVAITDAGIQSIAQYCPNLRKINLGVNRHYEDLKFLELEAKASSLSCLEFYKISKEYEDYKSRQRNITKKGLLYLAQNCEYLERISVAYCHRLGDEVGEVFANPDYFPNLEFLDLSDCYGVSFSVIAKIQQAHPNVQIKQERVYYPRSIPQYLSSLTEEIENFLSQELLSRLKVAMQIEDRNERTRFCLEILFETQKESLQAVVNSKKNEGDSSGDNVGEEINQPATKAFPLEFWKSTDEDHRIYSEILDELQKGSSFDDISKRYEKYHTEMVKRCLESFKASPPSFSTRVSIEDQPSEKSCDVDPETLKEVAHLALKHCDFAVLYELMRRGLPIGADALNLMVKSSQDIETIRLVLDSGCLPSEEDFRLVLKEYASLAEKIHRRDVNEYVGQVLRLFIDYSYLISSEILDLTVQYRYNDLFSIREMLKKATPTHNTLLLAAEHNHLRVVKLLLEKGVQPTEETLNIAVKHNTLSVARLFLEYGITPTQETRRYAILRKDDELLEKHLKPLSGLEADKALGQTGKQVILQGTFEQVEALLQQGFSVTEELFNAAIERKSSTVLEMLLKKHPVVPERSYVFAYYRDFTEGIELFKKYYSSLGELKKDYLTDGFFQNLIRFWKGKQSLILNGCTKLTDACFENVDDLQQRLPNLKRLNLLHCTGLTNKSLSLVSECFPKLEILELGLYKAFSPSSELSEEKAKALEAIGYIKNCSCLEELFLRDWPEVESVLNCLEDPRNFLNLKQLMFFDCAPIVQKDLDRIRKTRPLLKIKALSSFPMNSSRKSNTATFIPSACFGKKEWEEYFGDVEDVPTLPLNIQQILEKSCLIWPDKKIQDTHFLVLVPKAVNKIPLTLDRLEDLIKAPLNGGNPLEYRYYDDEVKKDLGDRGYEKSYWAFMTKDVIPDTRSKSFSEQIKIYEKLVSQSSSMGMDYQIPKALEATVCILTSYVRDKETVFYGNKPWTSTYCEEKNRKQEHVIIGGMSRESIEIEYSSEVRERNGLALIHRFY